MLSSGAIPSPRKLDLPWLLPRTCVTAKDAFRAKYGGAVPSPCRSASSNASSSWKRNRASVDQPRDVTGKQPDDGGLGPLSSFELLVQVKRHRPAKSPTSTLSGAPQTMPAEDELSELATRAGSPGWNHRHHACHRRITLRPPESKELLGEGMFARQDFSHESDLIEERSGINVSGRKRIERDAT